MVWVRGGDDNNDPHKCKKIDLYFTPDLTSKLSVRLSKCLGREGARGRMTVPYFLPIILLNPFL